MTSVNYPSNAYDTPISRGRNWTELSHTLKDNGQVIKCENIGGKNETINKPNIINGTKFGFQLPANRKIKRIRIKWEDRTVSYSNENYPEIKEPIIRLLNCSYINEVMGEAPSKHFTTHTIILNNPNVTYSEINSNDFGVSIEYPANTNNNTGGMYLNYISVEVQYENSNYNAQWSEPRVFKPDEPVSYDKASKYFNTSDTPVEIENGHKLVTRVLVDNPNHTQEGLQPINITIPDNFYVEQIHPQDGSVFFTDDTHHKIHWDVIPHTDDTYAMLDVWLISIGIGTGSLKIDCINNESYLHTKVTGFDIKDLSDDVKMNYGIFKRLDEPTEFEVLFDLYIDPSIWKTTEQYPYTFTFRVYDKHYEEFVTADISNWRVNPNKSNYNYIVSSSGSTIGMGITNQQDIKDNHFYWSLTATLNNFPKPIGDYAFHLDLEYRDRSTTYSFDFPFYLDEEPHMNATLNPNPLLIETPNLVTTSEEGGYCFGWMLNNKFKLHKNSFESMIEKRQKHIGGMIVENSHYDPKYSFSNPEKSSSFKTRKYTGKSGVWTDDLSLSIHLPPEQWKTLEGFTKMDKPVAIELCPKCSDDDLLNHRGWVTINKISNVKRTNSWVYNGDIEVNYLTRKYFAKANIIKGARICEVEAPYEFIDVLSYGNSLYNDFFISGNGQYVYDLELGYVNRVICNHCGDSVVFRTSKDITDYATFSFKWDSTNPSDTVNNYKSNSIRFNVLDKQGNTLLQYQLYDFTNYATVDGQKVIVNECNVNCNVYNDDKVTNVANKRIELDYKATTPNTYNSVTNFEFKGDRLTIIEEGRNGAELVVRDIELTGADYVIEVSFDNTNVGLTKPSFTSNLNVKYALNSLSNKYTNYYRGMLISPFPLNNVSLLFYRKTGDGVFYYYYGDTTANYLIDGLTQYKGGVNLTTESGASILYIDNYTSMLYMSNGLCKVGFDRVFGMILFYAYDYTIKKYVYVNTVRIDDWSEFEVIEYTDDKMIIQFGNTRWTMWRGHPYVQCEHIDVDIIINDDYDAISCEKIVGSDGTVIYDGFYGKDAIYLPSTVTSTVLSVTGSESPQILAGSSIKLVAKVYDQYGNNIANDGNYSTIGKVEFKIDDVVVHTSVAPVKVSGEYQWEYSFTAPLEERDYIAICRFLPNGDYTSSESSSTFFTVYRKATNTTLKVNNDETYCRYITKGVGFKIDGKVTEVDSSVGTTTVIPCSGYTVKTYDGETVIDSEITNTSGEYSNTNVKINNSGISTIEAISTPPDNITSHKGSSSKKFKLFVKDSSLTNINFTIMPVYDYGEEIGFKITCDTLVKNVKLYVLDKYNNAFDWLQPYYDVDLKKEGTVYVDEISLILTKAGDYNFYVEYAGSNNYNPCFEHLHMTINKEDINLEIKWLPIAIGSEIKVPDYIYYGDDRGIDMRIGAKLDGTGWLDEEDLLPVSPIPNIPVQICNENDELISSTTIDAFGQGKWFFNPKKIGLHKFKVKFKGNNFYTSATSNVIQMLVIDGKTSLYHTNSTIQQYGKDGFLLVDSNGAGVPQAVVDYYINGIHYDVTTDDNGYGVMPIGLNQGTYQVTLTYEGGDKYSGSTLNYKLVVKSPSALWGTPSNVVSVPAVKPTDPTDTFKQEWSDTTFGTVNDNNYAICGYPNSTDVMNWIGTKSQMYNGKVAQWNNPAILRMNKFGFNLGDDYSILGIKCEWSDRQVNADKSVGNYYPDIPAPVINIKHGDKVYSMTAKEQPVKSSNGLSSHLLINEEISYNKAQLESDDFTVELDYPSNNNEYVGLIYLKHFRVGIMYSKKTRVINQFYYTGTTYHEDINTFIIENEGEFVYMQLMDKNDKTNLPNEPIYIRINNVQYTLYTDSTGVAKQPIGLSKGTYNLSSNYGGRIIDAKVVVK